MFSPGFCLLAWEVPGTPLLRNRGPVTTLGGKVRKTTEPALPMICYMNTDLIQYGGWGVYDLLTMHAPIFAMYVRDQRKLRK